MALTTTVGMADMKVSANPDEILITYALGSCLGIAVHDPVARVGGLLHVMLPESAIDAVRAEGSPFMFVDTGVPQLFRRCYALGAEKQRMVLSVAGGATVQVLREGDCFRIGERNVIALRKLLWRNHLLIKAHDVGGIEARTMSLSVGTGEVLIRCRGITQPLN